MKTTTFLFIKMWLIAELSCLAFGQPAVPMGKAVEVPKTDEIRVAEITQWLREAERDGYKSILRFYGDHSNQVNNPLLWQSEIQDPQDITDELIEALSDFVKNGGSIAISADAPKGLAKLAARGTARQKAVALDALISRFGMSGKASHRSIDRSAQRDIFDAATSLGLIVDDPGNLLEAYVDSFGEPRNRDNVYRDLVAKQLNRLAERDDGVFARLNSRLERLGPAIDDASLDLRIGLTVSLLHLGDFPPTGSLSQYLNGMTRSAKNPRRLRAVKAIGALSHAGAPNLSSDHLRGLMRGDPESEIRKTAAWALLVDKRAASRLGSVFDQIERDGDLSVKLTLMDFALQIMAEDMISEEEHHNLLDFVTSHLMLKRWQPDTTQKFVAYLRSLVADRF